MKRLFTTCIIAACLLGARADAQAPSTNEALRYWMAFAVMHDPPAGQATAELLDRIAAGTSPWDEAKFGKLLDDNRARCLAAVTRHGASSADRSGRARDS